MQTVLFILSVLFNLGLIALLLLENPKRKNKDRKIDVWKASAPAQPEEVAKFYNQYNDAFLEVYGEVIQAYRTTDISKLLDYQIESIGFRQGQHVLDAGCGICGPAAYFAKKCGVKVDAITISTEQVEKANAYLAKEETGQLVNVIHGDYHRLPEIVEKDHYDIVYFLESFGHSYNHAKSIKAAWDVLKPGGTLYIKDLFRKIAAFDELQPRLDAEIKKINKAYRYNIADLYTVLHTIRQLGFVIMSLKTIDLKLDEFENLTISNKFQELTGIGKIENWEAYIFPIEFYELKCYKPVYDLSKGMDKYFLQNLYYMQVKGLKADQLDNVGE
ncbi:MAG: class I SAM-dependent methyltransferase [Bacteroidota bacterium]